MVASAEGGVNIEDVAASNPEAILKFPIDIHQGLTKEHAVDIADQLHIPKADQDSVADTFIRLYNIFQTKDATMVEINPFAEDVSGKCKSDAHFVIFLLTIFPFPIAQCAKTRKKVHSSITAMQCLPQRLKNRCFFKIF